MKKFFPIVILFLIACSGTRIKTYVNPSFSRELYQSFALLPIRNISLSPSEAIEINRNFFITLTAKNTDKRILGSVEANKLLNDSNLVSDYDQFLREFENTGVANTKILNRLGNQLGCSAIIQGLIINYKQDSYPKPKTTAGLRYFIISTKNGDILWESQCSSYKMGTFIWSQAPPLFDVLTKVQKKMTTAIPKL